MKFPACGAAELIHDTRDTQYTYKGETITIPTVAGDFCPACGEVFMDMGEANCHSAAMLLFNKQVNASIGDPEAG